MTIETSTTWSLYKISLKGTATFLATFPLYMEATPKRGSLCYDMLGGGTIFDAETKMLYLHYDAGASLGMFVEQVDVTTAKMINHYYYSHDLVSPIFSPDFNMVFSLEMDQSPPYSKYFASVNLQNGAYKKLSNVDWFVFFDNLAALKYTSSGTGVYYNIMAHNITSEMHLIGIDITNGRVISQPAFDLLVWNLFYVN